MDSTNVKREDDKNQEIKRVEDEDGWRWYELNGVRYLSVTLVLSCIVHQKLRNWWANTSKKEIDKRVEYAADLGSRIHEAIEKDIKKEKHEVTPDISAAYLQWQRAKENEKIIPYESETIVWSNRLGVAGQMDLFGECRGKHCVMDVKTGRFDVKAGWQMAAYKTCYEEMHNITGLGMAGISIPRDGSEYKVFEYEHFDFCLKTFEAALQVFKGLYFNKLNKEEWPWLKK